MISLEQNRTGPFLIGVECASRYPRHFAVVDDFRSIQDHRYAVGNRGYFTGLLLPSGLVSINGRNDEPVKSPLAMDVQWAAVAIKYLDLMLPTKIIPAIALRIHWTVPLV